MGAIGTLVGITVVEVCILAGTWMVCLWIRNKPSVIDDDTGTKDTE